LSGNSVYTKEWIESVKEELKELFYSTYIYYYNHWETGEKNIDLDFELRKLSEYLNSKKNYIIFAKSAGRNMLQLNDLPDEIVKGLKLNFEDLVLDSLRQKKFSHSSIVETAKELGDVNRTTISENFRGLVFKILVENNFNFDKTLADIACTDDSEVFDRLQTKMQTFLNNIIEPVSELKGDDYDSVRKKLSSKYKNLPQKFHSYLDEVIRHYLK